MVYDFVNQCMKLRLISSLDDVGGTRGRRWFLPKELNSLSISTISDS